MSPTPDVAEACQEWQLSCTFTLGERFMSPTPDGAEACQECKAEMNTFHPDKNGCRTHPPPLLPYVTNVIQSKAHFVRVLRRGSRVDVG
eukprot:gene26049-biopygen13303